MRLPWHIKVQALDHEPCLTLGEGSAGHHCASW